MGATKITRMMSNEGQVVEAPTSWKHEAIWASIAVPWIKTYQIYLYLFFHIITYYLKKYWSPLENNRKLINYFKNWKIMRKSKANIESCLKRTHNIYCCFNMNKATEHPDSRHEEVSLFKDILFNKCKGNHQHANRSHHKTNMN